MSVLARGAPPIALVELALLALRRHFAGERFEPAALAPPWATACAVFVTLRSPHGELRGCIGRTTPLCASLAAEVVDCAIGAATRDPRMRPLCASELSTLQVEVSVLSPPEPIEDARELDPRRFGVVVQRGPRRAVLLPGIEGVETIDEQLRLVLGKAGIEPGEGYRIERFTVDKVASKR